MRCSDRNAPTGNVSPNDVALNNKVWEEDAMGLEFVVQNIGLYDKLVWVLLTISALFAWIAFSCTGWGEAVSGAMAGTHYGLWRICTDHTLAPKCLTVDGWGKDWYAASQALITFGFLGINAAFVLQTMYMFLPKCMGRGEVAISTALVCCITSLLYLTGVIVFGAKFKEDFINLGDSNPEAGKFKLSYSFALSCVALTLELLAGVVIILINFKATGTNPEAPPGTCVA